jgi:hypothetical protein
VNNHLVGASRFRSKGVENSLRERSVSILGGNTKNTRRLVYYDDVLILMDDLKIL